MLLQLILIITILSTIYSGSSGNAFYVIDSLTSPANQTCYRQGQIFQPCDTFNYYSFTLQSHSGINISIYLLDSSYQLNRNSHFSFTGYHVQIRPWDINTQATINCTNYTFYLQLDTDIIIIQSVQFLDCGEFGLPVISLTRGRRLSQLFQILDLCFNKSRYTSIKVDSDVLEMKIYNTTFVEGVTEVIVIDSEVSTVTFEHNKFIRNKARVIYFWPIELPSNLTISNSNFDSNTYDFSESSIVLSYLHQVTITGCSFTGHSPKGVALLRFIDFVNVINSTFSNNRAQVGGALRIIGSFQSSVVLYGTKFSVNLALISGGAVYIDGNFETHIENSIFLKNTASSEDGGALLILNVANETSITRCVFKLNEATLEGGAVYIDTLGSITFSMCNFTNNTASRVGGAVKSLNGRLSVFKNQFINNAAYSGGGLQVSTAIIEVINTIWINNTATSGGHGGAILALGNLTIRSCNFLSNQANSGGALWKIKETTYILHTNFTKNIAGIEGGGAIFHGKIGTIILQTCSFNYNSALEGKGGALQGYATELK